MKDKLLKNFKIFKECLTKGRNFVYKKYKFPGKKIVKARPIIILNDNPPANKDSKVHYTTLTGEVQKAYQYRPKEVVVLRNGVLKYSSAFYLSQILTSESGKLHSDFLDGILFYSGKLSDDSIKYINKRIQEFLSDDEKAKTVSKAIRKAISDNE